MDVGLLDQLMKEHREVEGLLGKLEKATDAAEQQPLVDRLVAALQQHMEVEENQVYPELSQLDGEMATEAGIEHDLARKGLEQLGSMVGKPGFGAAVAMVQAGIQHHVEDEEGEAFPKLRKAIGARDTTGSSSAGDGELTKDELYEMAKEKGIDGRSSMTKEELAEALGR